ncbi:ABC-2 family transporter protein [compost metagenome]
MKLVASIIKSIKENARDWKVLVMVLAFAPFFILLMKLLYGGAAITYHVGVINFDVGKSSTELVEILKNTKGQDGSEFFSLSNISNEDELRLKVKDKAIDIGIIIPSDYSDKISDAGVNNTVNPAVINFYGSMGNSRYTTAAVMVADVIVKQGVRTAKVNLPSSISENFLEEKLPMNEFEWYVPGLISLAVLMTLFTASASIVRENEKKTLVRLKLSRLGAFNFLSGICIVQAIVAIAALVISYWTALGLGYKPTGEFGAVLFIGIISSLSMVAISLIVASFLNTVFDVLTVGCFPFFILMFFSGSMFPLPKMNLLNINGHSLGITDILPLTHTANAFNQILNFGAGITDILFDVFMISILTVLYFVIGLLLYQKRKLSKA